MMYHMHWAAFARGSPTCGSFLLSQHLFIRMTQAALLKCSGADKQSRCFTNNHLLHYTLVDYRHFLFLGEC